MPLPTPNLDDLRFQSDLVDEARRRIIRYCPEWTDYNLSDPGITLIEIFAWMTEMLAYRLNRVPGKNYIKFLEMLGVQLQPPSSARVELTFWLSTPFPITPLGDTVAVVPRGTQIATQQTEEEEPVTFTTDDSLVIAAPKLVQVRRDVDLIKNYLPRLGLEPFYAFNQDPQVGDTFYLGFDETQDIKGYILRLTFTCEQTQATGIRREDPPLVWECSAGNGEWEEIVPSTRPGEKDTTGGLNNPEGQLVLYLPLSMQLGQVHGRTAYWIRCRFEPRRPEQGSYVQSPRIQEIAVHALGGTCRATHAVTESEEVLGHSDGEPGQVFALRHAPVLALREDETVEIEEFREGEVIPVPWEPVPDFSQSDRYDRHFTLDLATGEICFGPSVRQVDGTIRQYGRVPEAGRQVRFSAYRYGGGVTGNVPADKIQVLQTAIPYVDRVTNLVRAEGGRDQETLEEAMMRARREMRAQQRVVTAEDFENLGKRASRSIARLKCRTPGKVEAPPAGGNQKAAVAPLPPGVVELLVVPAAFDAVRAGDLAKLRVDQPLRDEIRAYLDQYRLLTAILHMREPRYLGVQVTAEIVPAGHVPPETARARVVEALRQFITPLALSENGTFSEIVGHEWEGWPFGRDLYTSELFALIQRVPGVKHVLDVKLSYREVVPGQRPAVQPEEHEQTEDGAEPGQAPECPTLTPVNARLLEVPEDALLWSLDHDVQVVSP